MQGFRMAFYAAALAVVAVGAALAQTQTQAEIAASTPMAARQAVRAACRPDYLKLCTGVEPGGGHGLQCLREHRDVLSEDCKSALIQARAAREAAKAAAETKPN